MERRRNWPRHSRRRRSRWKRSVPADALRTLPAFLRRRPCFHRGLPEIARSGAQSATADEDYFSWVLSDSLDSRTDYVCRSGAGYIHTRKLLKVSRLDSGLRGLKHAAKAL